MKTLAMLGTLGENPQQKFKLVTGYARKDDVNVIGINENGNIDWYSEKAKQFVNTYFRIYGTLDWEWQQIQEPVDFVTALTSGRNIRPAETDWQFISPRSTLVMLTGAQNDYGANRDALVRGLWEIEP